MKRSRRTQRMNGVLLEEISSTALRAVKDPRLRPVTFTRVDVTSDLRRAHVYYSVMGHEAERDAAAQGLASATGVFKRHLADRLALRYMPELVFVFDASMQHAEHIEQLFNEIRSREGSLNDDQSGIEE